MENDAGRDAENGMRFAARCGFREARQKRFDVRGTPGRSKSFPINPAAERGGESVAGATCAEASGAYRGRAPGEPIGMRLHRHDFASFAVGLLQSCVF